MAPCFQWRYFLALLWFLAFAIHDCFRSSLSITIVCMVNHRSILNETLTTYENEVKENTTYHVTATITDDESCNHEAKQDPVDSVTGMFDWSKQTQGLLLGAVFWGYMTLQFPSGWLAERFGAHRVMLVFLGVASLSSLCTPIAAHAHPYVLLGVRIVTGMGTAVLLPALPVFWSNWAPPSEWSRLMGISLSGGLFGSAIIFPFGGYMCRYGFAGGWPSLYYVLGGVGLLWCLVWGLVVRDSPTTTSCLGEKEKRYIEYSTKPRRLNTRNGIYSMLPYLMFFVMVVITSVLTDCLITRCHVSVGVARKLLTSLGCIPPALCLLVLALVQCLSHPEVIALLCGAVGLVGFAFGGYLLNYADIAMHYAGTLSGIGNCISTIPGIVAPYIVASITENGTRQEWQYAFFTGVGSFSLAAVVFLCFGSGEAQPWARQDSTMTVLDTASGNVTPENDKNTEHSYA